MLSRPPKRPDVGPDLLGTGVSVPLGRRQWRRLQGKGSEVPMSSVLAHYPVSAIIPDSPCSLPILPPPLSPEIPNDFERLVLLMRSNERLLIEQQALMVRLQGARAYLADPNVHGNLARTNLQHLRT